VGKTNKISTQRVQSPQEKEFLLFLCDLGDPFDTLLEII
jgi:hypothetical protein